MRYKFAKNMFIFMILCLCFTLNVVHAQTSNDLYELFSKNYGKTNDMNNIRDAYVTSDDNYLVLGSSPGITKLWLLKTDNMGNELFSKNYLENYRAIYPRSIIEDDDGNYVAVGFFYDQKIFAEGAFIIKLDKDGNEIFVKEYKEAYKGNYELEKVVQSQDGSYIMCGSIYNKSNYSISDGWLLKIDKNGNEIFSKQYTSNARDILTSIKELKNGDIIAGGNTNGQFPNNQAKQTNYEAWLLRVDKDGNELFSKQYQFPSRNGYNVDDIIESANNTCMVLLYGIPTEDDTMILKIDEKGNKLFAKNFIINANSVTRRLYSITKTIDGNYYIAGSDGVKTLGGLALGKQYALFFKIDEDANILWYKQIGTNSYDDLYKVIETNKGDIVLFGTTMGQLVNQTKIGLIDAWISKFEMRAKRRILFDSNGGKGNMNYIELSYNQETLLPNNIFIKDGYQFNGWAYTKDDADRGNIVFNNRDKYKHMFAKNVTLYASWTKALASNSRDKDLNNSVSNESRMIVKTGSNDLNNMFIVILNLLVLLAFLGYKESK